MKVKFKLLLLMLGIGGSILMSSCSKDPDEGCRDEDCVRTGWVEEWMEGCVVPPNAEKVIRGEDGNIYRIRKDKTGLFASAQVGQKVRFGLNDIEPREKVYRGFAPAEAIFASLTCFEVIEEAPCSISAEVVDMSYQPNGDPSGEKLLFIGNHHYVVYGQYAADIAAMPAGTKLKVGYTENQPCFLTAVMTYPNRDGCIDLTCFTIDDQITIQH